MKFTGIVKKGSERGKRLGFPTANFDLPEDAKDGIYLGLANNLPALVFIGANKTFGETSRHAEVYLLNFDENLYGQEITVELLDKLRENKKFNTQELLVEQMRQDEKDAREFFKYHPPHDTPSDL